MLFLLGFGVLAIGYGLKGLLKSRAESYDTGSLVANIWGSLIVLIIGIVLTAIGIHWVLGFL
jgi:hypothetical protein